VGKRVVVTGSYKKSRTAWLFLRLILSFYKFKPIFVHEKSGLPKSFDALIISGGIDICPKTYGEKTPFPCNLARDEMELALLDFAVQKDLPVLGICRGMQLINVYFGGTLHPDINDLDLNRPHPNSPFPVNTIEILPLTKLRAILQTSSIKANALHHQAIKTLGADLRINAKDNNNIIQGIEHSDKFLIGVQWHPEYLPYSSLHRRLFKSFLNQI
jgi:putative glutamine amidotransferase